MKTLDEVIKAMEFCQKMTAGEDHCNECPYAKKDEYNDWTFDCNDSEVDALHYLKELQELRKTSQELRKTSQELRSDCEVLKNFWAEQQANPPLTFEELKAMQGKPVWVEADDGKYKGWVIVGKFYSLLEKEDLDAHVDLNYFGRSMEYSKEMYGYYWQAYRKERNR